MTVYLVGAGPGDPGLMTARALELIACARGDRLRPPDPAGALAGARTDAELIYAGKEGGGPSVSQAEIEALLLEHGAAGREVVRLKGGDPFVFGRGGEEAEALRAAGIPFEVVPGVTAGVAAPAYAGIPVTHRTAASAVAFVTGHEDPAKPESALDWEALAGFPGTLVVYMGVRRLEAIAERLLGGGRSAARACGAGAARHAARTAHGRGDAGRRSRRRRGRRASRRRRSRSSATSHPWASSLAWWRRPPLAGVRGGGDASSGPGQRSRRAAARAGRGGRGDTGDPDRRRWTGQPRIPAATTSSA